MTKPVRPPYLRRRLGAKLRRMREESGHTLDSAAPQLDKTRSALQRIESGETRTDVHLARSLMDLYDKYDPNLLDEVRKANKPPWYVAYGVKGIGSYLDVETEAAHVEEFSVQVVPGLLQTERYVRALFHAHGNEGSKSISVRAVRQSRLTAEDQPLKLTTVIDEAALVREVGGPEVMREQLRHLLTAATLPTVTLYVLPSSLGAYPAMPGAFSLLSFPDPTDQQYLFIEHLVGTVHSEDKEQVEKAKLTFRKLKSVALSPADSVALIERLAVEASSGSPVLAEEQSQWRPRR